MVLLLTDKTYHLILPVLMKSGSKRKLVEIGECGIHTSHTEVSPFKKCFLSDSEFLTFYSKSANPGAQSLSNFCTCAVTINFSTFGLDSSCTYPTGEHAFHGGKFKILGLLSELESKRKEELLEHAIQFEGDSLKSCKIKSAALAKRSGGKGGLRLTEYELARWGHLSMELQEQICRDKICNSPIREYLLSTNETYLVHHERATSWPRYGATVLKKENSPYQDSCRWMKGDNLLGLIWMRIREEIKQSIK